jgi:quinol monooxygenase YgiN
MGKLNMGGISRMLVVTSVFKVKEGKSDEFIKLIKKNIPVILKGPGALSYIFHRSVQDPLTFMVYEKYEDEKAFKYHIDHFGDVIVKIEPLLKGPPEGGMYQEIT